MQARGTTLRSLVPGWLAPRWLTPGSLSLLLGVGILLGLPFRRGASASDGARLLSPSGAAPRWVELESYRDTPQGALRDSLLLLDGGGDLGVLDPLTGRRYVWDPLLGRGGFDTGDLFEPELDPHSTGWTAGRGIFGTRREITLFDLARVGRTTAGREWLRLPGYVRHAHWSADGDRVCLTCVTAAGPQVWLADYPEGRLRRLPAWDGFRDPALSPTGEHLAAARDGDLWIGRLDGTERRRLGLSGARWPAWFLGERHLAFQHWQHGQWDIWKIDLETGRATRLTRDPADDVFPSWSREGWIAFGSHRGGRWRIWHLDGGEVADDGGE